MKIIIENCVCPSWNEIIKLHYHKRAQYMREIKILAYMEIVRQLPVERKMFKVYSLDVRAAKVVEALKVPVKIRIEAHFKGTNRRDPDNLFVKPIVDAVVATGLIRDDAGKYVKSVELVARVKMKTNKVIITINGEE